MRHFHTLAALSLILVACGGTSSLGNGQDGVGKDGGESTGGTAGKGGGTGGASAGTGGATLGTGGTSGTECRSASDCAAPALCKQCPDGSYSCASADCVSGKCEVTYQQCSGGGTCSTDADCPQPGAPCEKCADGSTACPQSQCQGGKCVTSFPTCPAPSCNPDLCPSTNTAKGCCIPGKDACGLDSGSGCVPGAPPQCTADSQCAVPAICMPCSDGSCVPMSAYCLNGSCYTKVGSCPNSGALKWYTTCGDPVCGGPNPQPSGLPPCDANIGQKAGEICTTKGAQCDPGGGCGQTLLCTTSDPTNGGNCPISRAKYKTDIEYLSESERAKLADDLQSIPLVRYHYKEGSSREYLGFIIEDIEPSPSVDSEHDRVDLYGYTSMAVAALQEQRKEIDVLRHEVQALKAELAHRRAK
jgi:hypothetical protein